MQKVVMLTRLALQEQAELVAEQLQGVAELVLNDRLEDESSDVAAIIAEPDLSLPGSAFRDLSQLRVIVAPSIGLDHIDVATAQARGVRVVGMPGVDRRETADHALAMILAVLRDIPNGARLVRSGTWDATLTRPHLVRGSNLGLLGFGSIAQLVAEDAISLGMNVLVHNHGGVPENALQMGVRVARDLSELLQWCDVLSIHVPLAPATRGLVGERQLRLMRPGAALVNTARGPIVDSVALLRALDEGHLSCAALDVVGDGTPAPDDPLLRHESVLVTPHMGWYSRESAAGLYRRVGGELRTFLTEAAQS